MGRSQPVEAVITVDRIANDAAAILDAERVRSAHVVGHSLGGLVALQMALSHRERVKSLALLCTFSGGKAAAPMSSRLFWLGLGTRVGTRGMRRRAFLKLVMPPGPIADADRMAERLSELFGHDIADQPPIASRQLAALRRPTCRRGCRSSRVADAGVDRRTRSDWAALGRIRAGRRHSRRALCRGGRRVAYAADHA